MRHYLILFALILSMAPGFGQTTQKETKPYTARILLTHGEKVKGTLWAATEDSIVLRNLKTHKRIPIYAGRIQWIKVRRQGRIGRGILIGTGSGLLVGVGLSAAGIWDNPIIELFPENGSREIKNEATAELMLGGAALGGAVGALVGSKSTVFQIQGDPKNYKFVLSRIRAYTQE